MVEKLCNVVEHKLSSGIFVFYRFHSGILIILELFSNQNKYIHSIVGI